jgi:uncharacterized repeat protein (TIGR01451 family)
MNWKRFLCLVGSFFVAGIGPVLAQSASITSFSPYVGTPGDTIKVVGSGFSSGHTALYFWNGQPAVIVVTDPSHLTATVPSGITTGALGVSQDGGQPNYTPSNFVAIGAGPYVTDFSPSMTPTGAVITIYGVHFTGAASYGVNFFSNKLSLSFSVSADGTALNNVLVPAGVTSGLFSVTSFGGGPSNSPAPLAIIGPGPFVSDFTPVSGGAGTPVTIHGRFFTSAPATNVAFNGLPGTNFNVGGDTLITVVAPVGVTTGPITVASPLGNFVTSSNFYAPPTLTGFSPASGRPGTNITLTGTSFIGATAVYFNGTASTNFTVVNNTTIHASVPPGATTGTIRVTTPLYSCFSGTSFSIAPTIYGFSPNVGLVGTSVTVTGANFNVATPAVYFNGTQAAAPSGVTFGQLTAVVPPSATTGPLRVSTTDGSDTTASNFYLPASISSFAPNAGAVNTWITVSGQNLVGATAVQFNGTPAAAFQVTNNTTLGAKIPVGVITGPLSVTTPAGTVTSAASFYGVPGITNFAPTHGASGTAVTITGTNLLGPTAVRFNGVGAGITSNSNTQLVTSVPTAAQTGPISVVTPAGTNTTAASFIVDHPSDLQTWGSSAPNPATLGSNLLYTITIVNYGPNDAPNAMVTNTLPPSVTLKSATINQGTLATNGNIIVGTLGTLVSGAAPTLFLTVTPQALGHITNLMSVSSGNPDPAPTNNFASIVTLVQSPAVLSIRQVPTNQVRVGWPLDLSNYVLQAKNVLVTNSFWSNVTAAVIISNNQNTVTEPATNSSRFYRLSR